MSQSESTPIGLYPVIAERMANDRWRSDRREAEIQHRLWATEIFNAGDLPDAPNSDTWFVADVLAFTPGASAATARNTVHRDLKEFAADELRMVKPPRIRSTLVHQYENGPASHFWFFVRMDSAS